MELAVAAPEIHARPNRSGNARGVTRCSTVRSSARRRTGRSIKVSAKIEKGAIVSEKVARQHPGNSDQP